MNAAQIDITTLTNDELEELYPIEIDRQTGSVWDSATYTEYDSLSDWASDQDDVQQEEKDGDYSPSFVKRQRPIREQY